MADQTENIQINISDTGTDALIQKLKDLGLSGDAAVARVESGFVRLGTTATAAASNANILAVAIAKDGDAAKVTADALDRMTNSELNAAARAQALAQAAQASAGGMGAAGQAATGAAAAHTALGAAAGGSGGKGGAAGGVAAAGAAASGAAQAYAGLSSAMKLAAGYLSVKAYVDAADAATKMDNQLRQVTKSSTEQDRVFQSLRTSANATGTSIEGATELFFRMSSAMQGTKVSSDTMALAVDTLTKTLYSSGVGTAQTSRVVRELADVMAKDGANSGRQWMSILMNAPGVLKTVAAGLNVTTEELIHGTQAQKENGDSAAAAQIKYDQASLSVDRASESLRKTDVALQNNSREWLKTVASGNVSVDQMRQHTETVTSLLNQKSAESRALIIADQKAVDASRQESGSVAQITAERVIDALAKENAAASATAAQMSGTIHGALTALDNEWIVYVGNIDKATGLNNVLRGAILGVAQNLNSIIPIIATFAGAWALNSAITSVTGIATGIGGLATLITGTLLPAAKTFATFLFSQLFTPWGAAIAAVVLASAAIYTNWDKISSVIGPTVTKWVDGLKQVLQYLGLINAQEQQVTANAPSGQIGGGGQFRNLGPNTAQTGEAPNVKAMRDGGAITVPGVGTGGVDSRLVQFMATPGERIIVQTSQQQIAGKLPHFRDGGYMMAGDPYGINTGFMASSSNSVTGYQHANDNLPKFQSATTVVVAADAAPATATSVVRPLPSVSYQAPRASVPDAIATIGGTITLANGQTFDPQGTMDKMEANIVSYNLWGSEASGNEGAQFLFKTPTGNSISQIDADEQWVAMAKSYGAVPWSQQQMFEETKRQLFLGESQGYSRAYYMGFSVANSNAISQTDTPVPMGQFHLRDGGDIVVPGSGAVDSRFVGMHVSPGEQISVRTRQQQMDDANDNGPRGVSVVNFHVSTPDAGSFRKSQAQIENSLAMRMRRINNR